MTFLKPTIRLLVLSASFTVMAGCASHKIEATAAQTAKLPGGISKQVVQLDPDHRLWIYRPEKPASKCPLILIAPAGSPLFVGMSLAQGDEAEHIPYAQAGCIVVAYDVSGPYIKEKKNMAASIQAFMDADGGVLDAKRALDYSLRKIPEIDHAKIVAAGHSSAATLALQITEFDQRIRACIAYAPVVDIKGRLGSVIKKLEPHFPGFGDFISKVSPDNGVGRIRVPLFLFHADDDLNAPKAPIEQLAAKVKGAKLVEVPSGGHYDSMIDKGIPDGIGWLKSLDFIPKK